MLPITVLYVCSMSCSLSTSQRHVDVADKENGPQSIDEIKLINAGKILENDRTLDESRTPLSEVQGDAITMLVVVQSPLPNKHSGNKLLLVLLSMIQYAEPFLPMYDSTLLSQINCSMNPIKRPDARARSCNVFGRAESMSFTGILHRFTSIFQAFYFI